MPVRPTSHGRRCSHGCSPSWTLSSSAWPRGAEAGKWLREDSSTRQSRSWDWPSHSWHRSTLHQSELQWHQSPLPPEPCFGTFPSRCSRYSSPPSPPCLHPTDEWLNCSLSNLHLHPWEQKSRSRMWKGGTPMHAEGCPSLQRPVAECPPLDPVQK